MYKRINNNINIYNTVIRYIIIFRLNVLLYTKSKNNFKVNMIFYLFTLSNILNYNEYKYEYL